MTSIGVFDVSSDPELEDEDEELVELVEQERDDSDVSDVTQFKQDQSIIILSKTVKLVSEAKVT